MPDKKDNLRHQLSHRGGPAAKWLSFLLFAIFLIHSDAQSKIKCAESIPDTPQNVAKALFGIKSSHCYTRTTTKKSKA